MIDIDIDRPTKYRLLETYFKAQKKFPDTKIEVFRSPSKGYHIKIWADLPILDRLAVQALLNDDPHRIWYILKRYGMGIKNPFIMFDKKNGKKCKKINMNKILKPHSKLVYKIFKTWGKDEGLVYLKRLARKVKI